MQPQNYPSSTECHLCQARAISFSKVHSDHRQIIYSNVDDQSSVAAVPQCSAQCGIAVPSAVGAVPSAVGFMGKGGKVECSWVLKKEHLRGGQVAREDKPGEERVGQGLWKERA